MNHCPICKKEKSKKGIPFSKKSLGQHLRSAHPREWAGMPSEGYEDSILDMVDLLAGDESDGVYWGIAYELGYF